MSARISLMYKRSGGCNTEHTCGDCRYYIRSQGHPREFMCEKHGEDGTYWKATWLSCKFVNGEKPKPAPKKRKPRAKKPKLKEEATGQLQLILEV